MIELIRSLLDPINLTGYILAGLLIRNYWGAVAVGVAWQSLLILIMVIFLAPVLQEESIPTFSLAARLVGAFTATSLVYVIARAFRENPAKEN